MLTTDYEIKLIDFGFGMALCGRSGYGYLTTRLGTPMYMAPEILDKTVPYQGQDADCFALGVLLFVSKVVAYPWIKPDIISDSQYILFAGNNGLNACKFWEQYDDRDLSEEFKNLIEIMLAVDPSSRPTMADILGHEWMRGKAVTKQQFVSKCAKFMVTARSELEVVN